MTASAPRRTYWHLEGLGRRPTDYDIATSRLLYHPVQGFSVKNPVGDWYGKHHLGARLRCDDWDAFDDPRGVTYTRYVTERRDREIFVDGLLSGADGPARDRELESDWVRELARILGPLRFASHGLQMGAAYLGSMAPSGKIATLFLFQAADQMRVVQRAAYRMAQLERIHTGVFQGSREVWMTDPAWQPTRELIERLLVAYDACDAFVGLCLVAKPALDEVILRAFGERARKSGDDVLEKMFGSLRDDGRWHLEWSSRLAAWLGAGAPENVRLMENAIDRFWPLAGRAVEALSPLCEPERCGDGGGLLPSRVEEWVATHWRTAGFDIRGRAEGTVEA